MAERVPHGSSPPLFVGTLAVVGARCLMHGACEAAAVLAMGA